MNIQLEEMSLSHKTEVLEIYRMGTESGLATFETEIPTWDQWDMSHHTHCRLVACADRKVIGWAALSPVSKRKVYCGVAEVSVYVHSSFWGQGIGKQLLQALIHCSERAGIWTLQSSIFAENNASVTLHQKCGFRIVGYREKIAQLNGIWRDTVLLERRSNLPAFSTAAEPPHSPG